MNPLKTLAPFLLGCAVLLVPTIAQCADAPPAGEITEHTFADDKIFPGTTRRYWVYVPKQYDGSKPACLFVCQDGISFNAPKVFDQLIAAKEMPVTIGIFITPGVVKANNPDTALDRFNRSYEYDGMGDNYARFLIRELIPHIVEDQHLKISDDPNDRAIAGASSGAIAAFTVAWEHPESFRRVFSCVGTFVGLRGGNEYPTLIRKYEPKPLRVFLEDGSKDQNIYGGDWWMANQEMERALTFAGYEVNHAWGDGGHNAQHATQIFPDAMRWMWKDYPTPIKTGLGSAPLQQILIPGEDWKKVDGPYKATEGPAVNAKGEVFFNDVGGSKTHKLALDGSITTFLEDSGHGDGQAFGPDGRLYACAGGAKQVRAYTPDGKMSVICDGFKGNDLVVAHNGGVYITESSWDGVSPSKVWYVDPKGNKKMLDQGLKFANGIALSPDQSLLYVDDMKSHWVYSYRIQPDGTVTDKQKYFHLHQPDGADDSGADGMRVDRDGRLYVSTRMGLQVCDQAGRVNCIIPTPNGQVSNLTFGGPNFDVIYATCGKAMFQRKVKVRGSNGFEAPVKPAAPHL